MLPGQLKMPLRFRCVLDRCRGLGKGGGSSNAKDQESNSQPFHDGTPEQQCETSLDMEKLTVKSISKEASYPIAGVISR